jgi:tRNA A37 threonylcarbamoyladenosine dehydratase
MQAITPPLTAPEADDAPDLERRFGGIGRLYGMAGLARFRRAHVCVVGVGGVGSWIVEALARSAIGELTLIDLDNVSESNTNRQIQAMTGTLGMAKIDVLAARIALINPACKVHLVEDFVTPENMDTLIGGHGFTAVIDAIDSVSAKAALLAFCRDHALPVITIGSAGGQVDPTKIAVRDLTKTEQEPLLKLVRKRMRNSHGFPRSTNTKFGVTAVFSMEPLTPPEPAPADAGDVAGASLASNVGLARNAGVASAMDANVPANAGGVSGLNCAGFGSSMAVTATFAMFAAGHLLRHLAAGTLAPPRARSATSAEDLTHVAASAL